MILYQSLHGVTFVDSLLVPRKLAATTLKLHQCDNTFLGHLRLLSLLQQLEGNTIAATEFIRLLEAWDLLQHSSPLGRERKRRYLALTVAFNPLT